MLAQFEDDLIGRVTNLQLRSAEGLTTGQAVLKYREFRQRQHSAIVFLGTFRIYDPKVARASPSP